MEIFHSLREEWLSGEVYAEERKKQPVPARRESDEEDSSDEIVVEPTQRSADGKLSRAYFVSESLLLWSKFHPSDLDLLLISGDLKIFHGSKEKFIMATKDYCFLLRHKLLRSFPPFSRTVALRVLGLSGVRSFWGLESTASEEALSELLSLYLAPNKESSVASKRHKGAEFTPDRVISELMKLSLLRRGHHKQLLLILPATGQYLADLDQGRKAIRRVMNA